MRTIKGFGHTNLLARELAKMGFKICGITESHLSGAGMLQLDDLSDCMLLFSEHQPKLQNEWV